MFFKRVDDWIIDGVFQHFADWYQARTERTNFTLARILYLVCFVLEVGYALIFYYHTGLVHVNAIFCGVLCSGFVAMTKPLEKLTRSSRTIYVNPYRYGPFMPFIRTVVSGLVAGTVAYLIFQLARYGRAEHILGIVEMVTLACGSYFSACSPRPPTWKAERWVAPQGV